jgi:hypothetical protein
MHPHPVAVDTDDMGRTKAIVAEVWHAIETETLPRPSPCTAQAAVPRAMSGLDWVVLFARAQ